MYLPGIPQSSFSGYEAVLVADKFVPNPHQ